MDGEEGGVGVSVDLHRAELALIHMKRCAKRREEAEGRTSGIALPRLLMAEAEGWCAGKTCMQRPLTLKKRTLRSPPPTTSTPTRELGCQATSTTPFPAFDASFFPVVGFWWFASRSRCISIVPRCRAVREETKPSRVGRAMNDFVELRRDERDGVPDLIRFDAHSGRGWRRSNLE